MSRYDQQNSVAQVLYESNRIDEDTTYPYPGTTKIRPENNGAQNTGDNQNILLA